ncbi:MAG: preprotein translocase subunit SecE [Bacilli bacterium]|nr:preprotein translocase subunit SecE [Bacilli bacterium]
MGLKKFTTDVVKEGKRVRWPKAEVLIPSIVVVLVISFLTGLILFGEDALGKALIDILKNNTK